MSQPLAYARGTVLSGARNDLQLFSWRPWLLGGFVQLSTIVGRPIRREEIVRRKILRFGCGSRRRTKMWRGSGTSENRFGGSPNAVRVERVCNRPRLNIAWRAPR